MDDWKNTKWQKKFDWFIMYCTNGEWRGVNSNFIIAWIETRRSDKRMKKVLLNDISFENKCFWHSFFMCSYPNAYDEELDITISDMEDEIVDEKDLKFWNELTGWYDGVLDDYDGYLEEPAYIETVISENENLKIEFHPGDIVYFINGEKRGNTGPHWNLNMFPFEKLKVMLTNKDGEILFWLLLPLAIVEEKDKIDAIDLIKDKLESIFEADICEKLARLVVSQLIEA